MRAKTRTVPIIFINSYLHKMCELGSKKNILFFRGINIEELSRPIISGAIKLGKTFPTVQTIYFYYLLTVRSSSYKHINQGYQKEFHRLRSLHYLITVNHLG